MSAQNTGRLIYANLEQVYNDTGLPTGVADKPNTPDDPDYVAPIEDTIDCPLPTPPESVENDLQVSVVNNSSQSVSWATVLFAPASALSSFYYKKTSVGFLPGTTTELVDIKQIDDLTQTSFTINGLSFGIPIHINIKYKTQDDSGYTNLLDQDMNISNTINQPLSTVRVDDLSTNVLIITITDAGVRPPGLLPPIVDAGDSQTVTLPFLEIPLTLTGTASSPNIGGSIASVLWTEISGPSVVVFDTPADGSTTVSNVVPGTYFFRFTGIDNRGVSAFDTTTVFVNPAPINPNGILNALVDPSMPDDTYQITQLALINISTLEVLSLIDGDGLNKDSGVVSYSPPKGTYLLYIDISGSIGESKSLTVTWGGGTKIITFDLPAPGEYAIENVVVGDGADGVLVNFQNLPATDPTFVIVWAAMEIDDPIIVSTPTLPNGMVQQSIGNVNINFFTDDSFTTPAPFTGNVLVEVDVHDDINDTDTISFKQTTVSAATTVIVDDVQGNEVFDYTISTDPQVEQEIEYELVSGQGYLFAV